MNKSSVKPCTECHSSPFLRTGHSGTWVKILLAVLSLCISIFIAEKLTGRFRHQTTYTQAYDSYNCYQKDDLLPLSLSKGKVCHMMSFSQDITINNNSLGFRGKEFAFGKNKGTTRILALGDSITFGVGVKDGETYPEQLEKILKEKGMKNIEVINAGYADAFSPDSYYLFLKKRGIQLKPDIVVVEFFVYSDISDLGATNWERVDKDGLPEKITSCCDVVDGAIVRNIIVDFKYRLPILRESQLYLLLINTLQNRFNLFQSGGYLPTRNETNLGCVMSPSCIHNYSKEEEKVYKVLTAMKEITEKEGAQFMVVLIPLDHQLNPQNNKFWYIDQNNLDFIQKRLGKAFAERGIKYLDLYPVFDRSRDRGSPFLPQDIHFNALGDKIIAESIADYLLVNGWVK